MARRERKIKLIVIGSLLAFIALCAILGYRTGYFYKAYKPSSIYDQIEDEYMRKNVDALLRAWVLPTHRKAAAKALGATDEPSAVPPLIRALKSRYSGVRGAAIESLREIGDPRATDSLIRILLNDNHRILLDSDPKHAVARNERGIVVSDLNYVEKTWRFPNRYAAAVALGEIGDRKAVPALIETLSFCGSGFLWDDINSDHDDGSVCRVAAEALGKIGNAQAIEGLISNCKGSFDIRELELKEVLRNVKNPEAIEPLCKIVKDEDSSIRLRETVIEALGEIGDRGATPALVEVLSFSRREPGLLWSSEGFNPADVRRATVKALGKIGDPRAIEPLKEVAKNDSVEEVRNLSIEALNKIQQRY